MKICKPIIILIIFFVGLFNLIANAQCSENEILNLRKTAIVFGEKDYKYYGPLKNTVNDANDITDSLKKLGFVVFTYIDANQQSMNDAVDSWCSKLSNYDVALFYFSGHGAEVNDENFLFPTDINPKGQSELLYEAFSANKLLATLNNSHLRYSIVILDACRNNPFTRSWGRGANNGGLAQMYGKGAFVAFAASPGKTASDGNNRNGTYTEGILKNIMAPNKTINDIFTGVNGYVQSITKDEQEPFYNTSIGTNYCFSVTRSQSPSKLSKLIYTYQRDAKLSLSPNQSVIYTLDNTTGEITIRDTKSSNLIRTLTCNSSTTSSIVALNSATIIAFDTVSRTIDLIDWQQDKVDQQLKVAFTPKSAILFSDMKHLLITGNNNGLGFYTILDLTKSKVLDEITLPSEIEDGVSDGELLYIISKAKSNQLTIFNIKEKKTIKTIILPTPCQHLVLSPNMQTIAACDTIKSQIFGLKTSDLKPDSSINVNAKSIAFTGDGRYFFALSDRQISIIRKRDGEKLRSLPFATLQKGLVLDNEGTGYIWLPKEDRIHFFRLQEQLKDTLNNLDPEEKYKAFQKLINNDPTLSARKLQREMCNQLNQYTDAFYQKLANEVIPTFVSGISDIKFRVKQGTYPIHYCDKGTAVFTEGIQSNDDQHKSIFPTFNFQFSDNDVTLTLQDSNLDKKTISKTFPLLKESKSNNQFRNPFALPLSQENQKELVQFVRNYFSNHLEYLN